MLSKQMNSGSAGDATRVKINDIVIGVLVIVVGGAVFLHASGFPSLPGGYPGPGLFPQLMASLLVLLGLSSIAQGLRPKAAQPDDEPQQEEEARVALPNAAFILLAIPAYMLLVERMGFPLTMILLNVVLMLKLGVRVRYALPIAVVLSLLVYYMFAGILYVPLPLGPWE